MDQAAETLWHQVFWETRADTRLPQSRAGGQGLYLRSLDHLGRSSKAKDCISKYDGQINRQGGQSACVACDKEVKYDGLTDGPTDGPMDGPTDGWTDGPTDKASFRVACPQLKM